MSNKQKKAIIWIGLFWRPGGRGPGTSLVLCSSAVRVAVPVGTLRNLPENSTLREMDREKIHFGPRAPPKRSGSKFRFQRWYRLPETRP